MIGISTRPQSAWRRARRRPYGTALRMGGLALAAALAGLWLVPARPALAQGPGSAPMPRAGETAMPAPRAAADPADVEFFEKRVRPVLAERCQRCHGPNKQKGGLRLDGRASALAGGESGPAVVPGKPAESLLVDAINYGDTYQMPPKSKLPAAEIAALTRWVEMGAPWGADAGHGALKKPPGPARRGGWQAVLQERSRHWSFQPIRRVAPPRNVPVRGPGDRGWPRNPIDQFVLAGLRAHGLSPAPEAEKRTLVRRLSYDLVGLPPKPEEIEAFLADDAPGAYERLVDRLLASPRYGERWARHWLDLVRFAETSGHEFDYDILNAYRYRDYVVRALNADLPFDRFVVEHLAGDLLEAPRRRAVERTNESVLATGFYFLGEGTHSPVDVRADEVSRIDNQIDVISKTFLGLTVACARCHDHKFDPIGAADYYALAGYLRSSRHQQAFLDPPERFGRVVASIEDAKREIAELLAEAGPALPGPLQEQVSATLGRRSEDRSRENAPALGNNSSALRKKNAGADAAGEVVFEDFHADGFDGWFVTGPAFGARPTRGGDFRLDWSGPAPRLVPIAAGRAHSGAVSDRLWGVLRSRTFTIEKRYIHCRAAGRGGTINIVIDNFEKIRAPIYGGLTQTVDFGDRPGWTTLDVGMWLGHSAYLELADGAVVDYRGATSRMSSGAGRLVVDEVRMSNSPRPSDGAETASAPGPALDLGAVVAALRAAGDARGGRLAAVLDRARAIENSVPEPALGLAIADGTGQDEAIQYRGNYKTPGPVVPRRFLEVLGGQKAVSTPASASNWGPGHDQDPAASREGSGRLELARRFIDPEANPLTPRVLVNRLWQHHFGTGIVKSVDDFGAMGRAPSHPELLDWLASELVRQDWSIKAIQRLIVTSSAYRMSSTPSAEAERADPENVYLHRMNGRRLEAEALRDALLAVSGRLVEKLYGPSVPVHLTSFMEGRGRPARSGPWDGDGRRSLYVNVRRNFLDPMLAAFDVPAPFSTMGRRNVSQVPAQALVLMNGPAVVRLARLWAGHSARPGSAERPNDRERIAALFVAAFGRPPEAAESRACLNFLAGEAAAMAESGERGPRKDGEAAWAALCHVLFNMKEFIFIN